VDLDALPPRGPPCSVSCRIDKSRLTKTVPGPVLGFEKKKSRADLAPPWSILIAIFASAWVSSTMISYAPLHSALLFCTRSPLVCSAHRRPTSFPSDQHRWSASYTATACCAYNLRCCSATLLRAFSATTAVHRLLHLSARSPTPPTSPPPVRSPTPAPSAKSATTSPSPSAGSAALSARLAFIGHHLITRAAVFRSLSA
jgi:hypothetical protein